jgi:hypothetical protein
MKKYEKINELLDELNVTKDRYDFHEWKKGVSLEHIEQTKSDVLEIMNICKEVLEEIERFEKK